MLKVSVCWKDIIRIARILLAMSEKVLYIWKASYHKWMHFQVQVAQEKKRFILSAISIQLRKTHPVMRYSLNSFLAIWYAPANWVEVPMELNSPLLNRFIASYTTKLISLHSYEKDASGIWLYTWQKILAKQLYFKSIPQTSWSRPQGTSYVPGCSGPCAGTKLIKWFGIILSI